MFNESVEFLTVDAAARLCGLSRPMIYKLIQQGILPNYRFGRSIRLAKTDIVDFISSCRQREQGRQGRRSTSDPGPEGGDA